MAPRSSRTAHPAVSQQIEQMLKARSIDFDFEPNVRISEIRDAEGNQVRLTEHRAPKEQVDKYAVAMKHGATFPAIILNDRLERIDGNTRLEACIKNGDDTVPAYICHGLTPLEARSLSVELNQSNGLAMTDEEIRKFIDGAVMEGQHADLRTLARMTGVRETKIARWIAETQYKARAEREGIDERYVNVLPASTRAALHATRLAAVFHSLTQLAAEARMPAVQVKRIVAQANAAPSESEALAVVDAERDVRSDEIRAVASGFSPRDNRRSKGSAQHIGGLVRFEVDALLDVAPEKQFDTFQRIKLLRDRLDQVVARAEREWDLTPPIEEAEDAASVEHATGAPVGVAG
jgi:ParB-like chromosome segregation protein Spo0J